MTRSARLICILLAVVVAAVATFLTSGPTATTAAEREPGDTEADPNGSACATPDSTDLVVDLYLV
ncbi:hypothetical protein [Nocardia aurea]|uniref:hypothetical protein n=1 Tax=Nocardia aurea TaxID=2144174 RepID=UPI0033A0AAEA